MKTITIIGAEDFQRKDALVFGSYDLIIEGSERMSVSDGFHTFEDFYDHRIALYIALCKAMKNLSDLSEEYGEDKTIRLDVWRSKLHSDGSSFEGWFILGMFTKEGEQITYHLPIKDWDKCYFAETLEKAPQFDGHTSTNVLERLGYL